MKWYFKILYLVLLVLMVQLFLQRCANPVTPAGGPKDLTPPAMVKAEPKMYTTNFNTDKIRIYFDEFIELKELQNQVIISPPMKEQPKFRIKGRSVVIELQETLKDSTTYNIFFGNAIVDITEKNPIANFQYVFSTWDVVDSLSLEGEVLDAFDLTPAENVNIMLYMDNNDTIPFDSLPYFVRPYFLSKSKPDGSFRFNSLPDKKFKLFALEDGNGNLIFDQPSERIAFIDSLVAAYYIEPPAIAPHDSLGPDTLGVVMDTITIQETDTALTVSDKPDTLQLAEVTADSLQPDSIKTEMTYPSFSLRLFQEVDSVQRFMKATLVKENHVEFIFKRPVKNPGIRFLNMEPGDYNFIEEWNQRRDTLIHWITHAVKDSLVCVVSDDLMKPDTVELALKKVLSKREEKKQEEQPTQPLKYTVVNQRPELDQPVKLEFRYPVVSVDSTGIFLSEGEDTLTMNYVFKDSIQRVAIFDWKWKEMTAYQLVIPDSAFTDILGRSNDTIHLKFTTKSLEDYGNLFVDISIPQGNPYIIRLLKNEKVTKEFHISESQRLSFKYLIPGDYRIKAIRDENRNETWDPGDYIYGIQPEEVSFYEKTITVRANWDIEEEWNLRNE